MKGQINIEFLASALIYLLAIGSILIIGTNMLPEISESAGESDLNMEAYKISTQLLTQPGYSSFGSGTTDWHENPSTVQNTIAIGLANKNDSYLNLDRDKIKNLKYRSPSNQNLTYQQFKELTGADNQYLFNFTWRPILVEDGQFQKNFIETSPPKSTRSDALRGYWPLDEVGTKYAADYSGFENNGTLKNGVVQGEKGVLGRSYFFDGSDDYVNIDKDYRMEETTWSFWVKSPDWSGKSWIAHKWTSTTDNWGLMVDSGRAYIFDDIDGGNDYFYGVPVKENEWIHMAATIESDDENRLYINGRLVGKGNYSNDDLSSFSGEFIIGRRHPPGFPGTRGKTEGLIDDVRIYDKSLTKSKIQEIYDREDRFSEYADNYPKVPVIEPESASYANADNKVYYGKKNLSGNDYHFLSTSINGEYKNAYLSDDWNFSKKSALGEGSTFSIYGPEFRIKDFQNRERTPGTIIVLEKYINDFGANPDSDSTVVRLDRFAKMDGEPLQVKVLAW